MWEEDVDGNGFLDRDEIKILLVTMGDPIAEKRIEQAVAAKGGPFMYGYAYHSYYGWLPDLKSTAARSVALACGIGM